MTLKPLIAKIKQIKPIYFLVPLALLLLLGLPFWFFILKDLPNPSALTSYAYPESSKIFDRHGKLLYEFFSDKKRDPIKLTEIPQSLKNATLAIEDANFYHHIGFDFRGILRGLYRTVFKRRTQSGSTLTQQLVKNALLTPERTLQRKIKEALLTLATELKYSKDQILEMYFNQTPYGGTLWGVQAAAKGIFNKDAKDLTLAQSALLAGLPASPSLYSPFSRPDLAKKRQIMVLDRMKDLKMIDDAQYQQAKDEKLNYFVDKKGILAPHFVFYTKEKLVDKYGIKKITEGGLNITSTLDWDLQQFAETTVASEVAKLNKYNVTNGAVLITEPKSGQILAMVGSKDYFAEDIDGKYNLTTTATRQPGSSIKPLNYAVGLELGRVTLASVFDDAPTCFGGGPKAYCPTNYGNHYYGLQTLRHSLANSLNIAAVKMLKINGLETFIASASAMGITTFNDSSNYGYSLTLGGGEVYMSDMSVAFGVLANMGLRQDLTPILQITDNKGAILEQYGYVPGNRVLSKSTAFLIHQVLSDDGARSMVFGAGSMLNIKNHPEVAVKTGTTNDLKDNWTIGYTPDVVITVWVGNNDNTRMKGVVSGTTGAAPIWNRVMTKFLTGKAVKKPIMPSDIVGLQVCNLTGQLVPDDGCESHFEYFKNQFKPTDKVSTHLNLLIDKDTGLPVSPEDGRPNTEWQGHTGVRDASGVWVCLDCPLPGGEKPSVFIN